MKTVIDQMLVKAGAYFGGEGVIYADFDPKKFAELVRADAIADEREACAQEVENYALGYAEPVWAFKLSSIIRDRGHR